MAFLKCIKNSKVIPNGKTVTPTDDVQIWLHCADIWDKDNYTIDQIVADTELLITLVASNNAIDYMVRSTSFINKTVYTNQTATRIIGENDYASDILLADDTWRHMTVIGGYSNEILKTHVPSMTSATTPSGEVTADSTYANYYAWYPFRDNNTTAWISNHNVAKNATASGWLQYEFARKVKVYRMLFTEPTSISQVQSFTIQASNDGINFEDMDVKNFYDFAPSQSYKYWRMAMTSKNVYSSATYVPRILILKFMGREKGGVQDWLRSGGITNKTYIALSDLLADTTTLSALIANQDACDYLVTAKSFIGQGICDNENFMTALGNSNYASNLLISDDDWLNAIADSQYSSLVLNIQVPKMTSDTTPSGQVLYSAQGSSDKGYMVFDESNSTKWTTSAPPQYIGYDFSRSVRICRLYLRARANTPTYMPTEFKLQGSSDNSTWNDVESYTNSVTSGDVYFMNTNDDTYRYWRLYITSSSASGGTALSRLQFYGREDVT